VGRGRRQITLDAPLEECEDTHARTASGQFEEIMLNSPDLNVRLEMLDSTDTVVEVFFSQKSVRALLAERDNLKKDLAVLQDQFGKLRQERDALRQERDIYLQALHTSRRELIKPMTAEELADLKSNGVSQEKLLEEIDALFPPNPSGG
jgi:hypothetical protein